MIDIPSEVRQDYSYPMRDQIHERIELKPDGTRLPFQATQATTYAKSRQDQLQLLNRSHSIR